MAGLLQDCVALVTGSTTGIGEATARRVVEEGGRVMIHGRNRERAEELVEELGEAADFFIGDLGDPAVPARLVAATIERFERLDGIVNNAALTTRSSLETTDADTFDRIIAVNLRAPLLIIRAALEHFRERGRGSVVNVGSINALGGEPNLLAYSISKGGMQTMTRNLADRHAREGIRINQINVGWTLTENEQKLKEKEGLGKGWEERLAPEHAPFGRIFRPHEVAGHIVYWLSDAAGPANGSVFELEQHPMIGRNPAK